MISPKNNGYEFLEFIPMNEGECCHYQLSGSYAVIKCDGKYLLCYNTWRNQWEIPAGGREGQETPEECAIRELYEETGQSVVKMDFKGLLKSKNVENGKIRRNPVYFATLKKLDPFKENEETSKIMLWDLKEDIGNIDGVDLRIFDYVL